MDRYIDRQIGHADTRKTRHEKHTENDLKGINKSKPDNDFTFKRHRLRHDKTKNIQKTAGKEGQDDKRRTIKEA